ncbi:ankyrin repeat and death domain-containing protein 1A-like [Coregonus clupeaformis]|uniref:ankyrin repeat and death domain-containing protein 1A-like n=1 Tax=Coregonus clupeaformis TaxID=59861 RepID=UPI001E1C36C3|nr:ankyrin repeat and death domain-containing protein 1A-like [Coregonus clupeaformis]
MVVWQGKYKAEKQRLYKAETAQAPGRSHQIFTMERRSLKEIKFLKERMGAQLKELNLNPKTRENTKKAVKGFTDFIQNKETEETDNSYDNKEMLLALEKEYIDAAKINDVQTMKLLGRAVNVDAKNLHDRTALHYAVAGKNIEAVQVILQRRANLNQADKHGVTAIHLAAWFGSVPILKLLVQGGADPGVQNVVGMNILHCAAINNHTDIVTFIIYDLMMKELDKEDLSGHRAFALAAEHGSVEMLQMLMEEAYNMATMEEDQNGDTPLHLAASNGHLDAVQLLLKSFDTRDEVNMVGETALYLAADAAHEDCVQALLEAGCDLNIVTMSQCSALHPVSEKGHTSLVKLLIENSAQMDLQNQHLQAPLYLAVKNCHIPVIHTLLEAGCNINITDHRSQTVLHVAAELARVDIVDMLLKAGMDLTLLDKQGKTALGVAARADEVIIVDMIIKAERYFTWRRANTELNENLHSQCPLTFKIDHRAESKQVRGTAWHLAYHLLEPGDWKRLALHWNFTEQQVAAIEVQWTGKRSYQDHGNRMLLIWLHGSELAQRNPAKELYQGLLAIGKKTIADKIRMDTEEGDIKKCILS